jgi:hypothetical protein
MSIETTIEKPQRVVNFMKKNRENVMQKSKLNDSKLGE